MQKNEQYRHAVRGVWEHGHATFEGWPADQQALVQPGVDALLAWLADAGSEEELIDRYLALNDPARPERLPRLYPELTLQAAIAVEDECFWRRAVEIGGGCAHA